MKPKNLRISKNWKEWITNFTPSTCEKCSENNGKIFPIYEVTTAPPLHPNCHCILAAMQAIIAGEATKMGKNGADWQIAYNGKLPDYYYTKEEAKICGWKRSENNLAEVLPGKMIFGGIHNNRKSKLPHKEGRIWYEADINYEKGGRNSERIVFSNDGLIFATYDHYKTFYEIITEE